MHALPRRQFLRDSTSQAHKSLDELIGAFDTITAYKTYLAGTAAFRLPLEVLLETYPWPERFGMWRPTCIGHLIRLDLADLAMPVPRIDDAPARAPLSPDEMIGLLYVLEGSSLGARILAKRASAIGLTATHGARHLLYQAQSHRNWQHFLELLNDADPFDGEASSMAAIETFRFAQTAFREGAHVAS